MSDVIAAYGVELRPILEENLEQLRIWRNSPDVARQMVNQDNISKEQQQNWFHSIQQRQDQIHYSLFYRHQLIGAANLKTLDTGNLMEAKNLEPGIYIGDERYRSNILAFAPSLALLDYCFDTLKVTNLCAKVKEANQAALSYNYKLGYAAVDTKESFVHIQLTKTAYQEATKQIKPLFLRNRKS